MALVTCPECKHQVSTDAKTCPQCGKSLRRSGGFLRKLLGFFGLIFGGVILLIFFGLPSPRSAATNQLNSRQQAPATPAPPLPTAWEQRQADQDPQAKKLVAAIESAKWWDLCTEIGRALRKGPHTPRSEAVMDFLIHRDYLNAIDLDNIRGKTAAIGMTQCGAYASWGVPEDNNYSTSATSKRTQMVYGNGNYLYTEGRPGQMEIVTNIQN